VNNLNKETQLLKKRVANIRLRTREIKESLSSINVEIDDCDLLINE